MEPNRTRPAEMIYPTSAGSVAGPLLLLASIVFALLWAFFNPAQAQSEACLPPGVDDPLTSPAAVKRPGEPTRVTWTDPNCTIDGTPLSMALEDGSTPFALTEIRAYSSMNSPVDLGSDPSLVIVPGAGEFIPSDQPGPGERLYISLSACNAFGCAPITAVGFSLYGGPPRPPTDFVWRDSDGA